MGENTFYQPVGEWLLEEKGCQDEAFFHGYTSEPSIPDKKREIEITPDIVGVRYERSDTKTPSYNFHFHIVEIQTGTEPEQLQNLMGELEFIRELIVNAVLAADTISFYAAVPTDDVPDILRNWAQNHGVGILALKQSNGSLAYIRELLTPEPVDCDFKRSEFLSNRSQRSPGNFCKAVEDTSVLDTLMNPAEFYDTLIRPDKDRNRQERNYNAVFTYITNKEARQTLDKLTNSLTQLDHVKVRPHSGSPKKPILFIDSTEGNTVFKIVPLRNKFKIVDTDDDVLFRIISKNNIEITQNDITDLRAVQEYISDLVEEA